MRKGSGEGADFSRAKEAANALLLRQRAAALPVSPAALRYDRTILFDSVRHFCETTCSTVAELTEKSGCLHDGCTLIRRAGNREIYIVLYNDRVRSAARRRFTLAHEIGHICLGHQSDGDRQEVEANFFAAQLLMPHVLVRELGRRFRAPLVPEQLADVFGVSLQAAAGRIRSMAHDFPPTDSDRLLLRRMGGLLPYPDSPAVSI